MPIQVERDEANITTLTIDLKDRSTNVLTNAFLERLSELSETLINDPSVRGIILTSAKRDFVVGADLDTVVALQDPEEVWAWIEGFKGILRSFETCGKPVVAALNGTALGGGYELALACHHRIAIDHPKLRIGLPEVKLGLLPGGGGTLRLSRMIGIQNALPLFLEGKVVSAQKALKLGLVDSLATNVEDLQAKAKAWIEANPSPKQPWDEPGFKWPGGSPKSAAMTQLWSAAPAMLNQKTYGNYPAGLRILACVQEGSMVDFETASRIESRYAVSCADCKVFKNLIHTMWFQLNEIKKGKRRPNGYDKHSVEKVGILGAGMMGAGIAYATAKSGIQVVLKDVDVEMAQKGKAHCIALLEKQVKRGQMAPEQRDEIAARIVPTNRAEDLSGCELIIEAVFEDRELKAKVTKEAEAQLEASAFFASNTSTLPITGLAEASVRPEKFIGLHFFSPVDKMQLVEIILGKKTDPETLAKAFDYVQQIKKVPIVVNDSRGFYTSRVFEKYLLEGLSLVGEGQHPRAIESAALQAGLPVGPLAVLDEVSLRLMWEILEQTRRDLEAQGMKFPEHPGLNVVDTMVNQLDRHGKKAGRGFYNYPKDGKKFLWEGLEEAFPRAEQQLSQDEMISRLMFAQVLEAVQCLEEDVVTNTGDANIGSIFGWGFAPFKGGVIQYINDYGVQGFAERAQRLADDYGPRFKPGRLLMEKAELNQLFD